MLIPVSLLIYRILLVVCHLICSFHDGLRPRLLAEEQTQSFPAGGLLCLLSLDNHQLREPDNKNFVRPRAIVMPSSGATGSAAPTPDDHRVSQEHLSMHSR